MSSRILPEFEMLVPQSMGEAISSLSENKGNVSIMAGGTDLLVNMKGGMKCTRDEFDTHYVLSLSEIPDLDTIQYDDEAGLKIGAMATLSQVGNDPVVKEKYPALWEAISVCGTVQTRNMGTVVGNLLNASPCADCSCAILAIGGTVVLEGPDGRRDVDIDKFWLGYRLTARHPDEIAVAVKLPLMPASAVTSHVKMTRVTHDLAKLSAAVRLDMAGNTCQGARIVMGSVAPIVIRVKKTEQLLAGVEITDELLESVAKSVSSEITPIDDVRSTAEYRREVGGVLVKRTILNACRN
ncbi:MAG: xanthine dehydrogenase family protein subunit M [Deltaproteobacteria bacterium]|nr:xanthine dehydrogenase family protein subunit M [Deltaproteobacteria bacterium]